MARISLTLRAWALYGLLAVASAETGPSPTPAPRPLYRRSPQADDHSEPESDPATITAVSECHMHGTVQYCQAGTAEFRVSGTATASSYTDCHNHGAETFCMAPTGEVQIFAAEDDQTPTPTPTGSSITAVSECHTHGSTLFCMAGTAEYEVHTTVTATQDIPPAFTGCHSHDAETFCIGPDGEEVEIHPVAAEEEEGEDHDHGSEGQHCHFHAGVEHCVGGSGEEEEHSCERVDRDYNIRLRVGLLFVMLVTSSIGVFTPILVASYVSPSHPIFTVLRQFGTGVIISTAFVHLYTHASLMFQNQCLGELAYESTAAAILMAGIFLSFLVEYLGNRLIQWHEAKAKGGSIEAGSDAAASLAAPRTDMVNITVLEAGVIFHSLLIGLTLVVAGDSFFLTLFAVIVFHQMFEGLALGTRIASLGRPCPTSAPAVHGDGHNHPHGHEHYHTNDGNQTADQTAAATKEEPASGAPSVSNDGAATGPGGQNEKKPVSVGGGSGGGASVPMTKKLLLALGFALVTPVGMAIGIGVLRQFNGNDPSTVIAIGTLDALSAGILVWVGVVEMWAHDWMLGGEMTRAGPARTFLGLVALVVGMALMSLLGKWA